MLNMGNVVDFLVIFQVYCARAAARERQRDRVSERATAGDRRSGGGPRRQLISSEQRRASDERRRALLLYTVCLFALFVIN